MMPDQSDLPAPPTFESALDDLQAIVRELEDGQIGLEASLSRFEEGVRLLRSCYSILERAEQRIEILTGFDAAGNPLTAPFDATATTEAAPDAGRRSGRRRQAVRSESAGAETPAQPSPARPDDHRLF